MRDNALRKKLAKGEKALGLWAAMGSKAALEMAAPLGFDWVLIDCEHGVAHVEALTGHLRALNGSDTTSIVRLPSADNLSDFKRVLDAGAEGVLVPQVYTADQVRGIVSACRYPPQGTRGIAAGRPTNTAWISWITWRNPTRRFWSLSRPKQRRQLKTSMTS